jgi:hypothetical protein
MLLVILGVAAAVIGIVIATRQGRQFAARNLLPSLRSSLASLRRVARSPAKLTLSSGGSALVTLAYVGGLAASVEAFGCARCQRGQARQASPLRWWGRSRYGPAATAASPCHSRPPV